MADRVLLVVHGATEATRRTRFPLDEPLEPAALEAVTPGRLPARGHRDAVALTGSALRCRQTAHALGLSPTAQTGLDDWDLGRWAGRTLDEVVTVDPDGVRAWLTEPAAAPHGGESLEQLGHRVGRWLDDRPAPAHRVAVTHPAVLRAALVHALQAPARSFWRVDAAPLSIVELRGGPGRWSVRL